MQFNVEMFYIIVEHIMQTVITEQLKQFAVSRVFVTFFTGGSNVRFSIMHISTDRVSLSVQLFSSECVHLLQRYMLPHDVVQSAQDV